MARGIPNRKFRCMVCEKMKQKTTDDTEDFYYLKWICSKAKNWPDVIKGLNEAIQDIKELSQKHKFIEIDGGKILYEKIGIKRIKK